MLSRDMNRVAQGAVVANRAAAVKDEVDGARVHK